MPEQSDTYLARWRRERPEANREHRRRDNLKRPDRDRGDYVPCSRCGAPRKKRGNKSGLCRACWRGDRS